MAAATHRNSDGTEFRARVERGIMGTLLRVTHSTIKTAGGELLWDHPYGTALWYLPRGGRGQLVRITHPDYEYAATRAEALRKALAFFGESYESCLKHAAEEGIDVRGCFAKS